MSVTSRWYVRVQIGFLSNCSRTNTLRLLKPSRPEKVEKFRKKKKFHFPSACAGQSSHQSTASVVAGALHSDKKPLSAALRRPSHRRARPTPAQRSVVRVEPPSTSTSEPPRSVQ